VKLVVAGASGFLGRNAVLRAPRDWTITAVYNAAADFPAFVAREPLPHVRPVRCDLTNAADVRALGDAIEASGGADAVLYLAANGDPAASARDPLRDLQLNTVALVTFLQHVRAPRIVYLSSGAVYDGLSGVVTPASPVNPRLPYAISKLACEQYVRFFSEKSGAPASYINVRFFGAYGPYEPLRKITTRFLTAVQRGDDEFVLRGDGRNLIDFMYVDDAVDALLRLASDKRPVRATVDFTSGQPTAVGDIVGAMQRLTGSGIRIRREGITEEYIEFRSGDRRIADEYGVAPAVSFDEGFTRLRDFIAANQDAAVRG